MSLLDAEPLSPALFEALKAEIGRVVGAIGILGRADIGDRHRRDWSGMSPGNPQLVVRPATTDEVSAVMRLCHAAGQTVVLQGGMTGLVGSSVPRTGEIALSLERMRAIEDIDHGAGMVTVEAGAVVQAVQEAVDAEGLFLPLDLGSRGSATIGGVISTNAGGNRVIRYGMMRDMVVGLEVVMADGTVITSMRKTIKNNAGYDLRQLFIGSEGTLGIVTRALLKLRPKPGCQPTAFCAVPDLDSAVALLRYLDRLNGGNISAFEAMWPSFYEFVISQLDIVNPPLDHGHPLYLLIETTGADQADALRFESALSGAIDAGMVSDAVIAQSGAEVARFWDIRDGIGPASKGLQPFRSFDLGFDSAVMTAFLLELPHRLASVDPGCRIIEFGHVGDGNLHLLIGYDEADKTGPVIDQAVYDLTGHFSGSISAEHGIGIEKRPYLDRSRSSAEIQIMQSIKAALDPKAILNRNRIFNPLISH